MIKETDETVGNFNVNTFEDYLYYINNKPNYKKELVFRGIKSLPKDFIKDERKPKRVTKRQKAKASSLDKLLKYIYYNHNRKYPYVLRIRRKYKDTIYENFTLLSEAIEIRDLILKNI